MKELVQFLARQLVNDPDAVEVKETHGDSASVLELRVAKEDLGRVIGKQGRTVNSVRTILNAVGSRTNRNLQVRSDPVAGERSPAQSMAPPPGHPETRRTSRARDRDWGAPGAQ